jgi:hypothetical protein
MDPLGVVVAFGAVIAIELAVRRRRRSREHHDRSRV